MISFFSSRLEQAGAQLSVERVLEIIKQGAVALPKDRLRVSGGKDLVNSNVVFQLIMSKCHFSSEVRSYSTALWIVICFVLI